MAHLVAPISFRLGKTFAWKHNLIFNSQNAANLINGDLGLALGLDGVAKYLLKKHRIFVVKGSLRYSEKRGILLYKMLYAPRMKQKPIDGFKTGTDYFFKFLHSPRPYGGDGISRTMAYTLERIHKKADLPMKWYRRINPWLSARMFRGSKKDIWHQKLFLSQSLIPNNLAQSKVMKRTLLAAALMLREKRIEMAANCTLLGRRSLKLYKSICYMHLRPLRDMLVLTKLNAPKWIEKYMRRHNKFVSIYNYKLRSKRNIKICKIKSRAFWSRRYWKNKYRAGNPYLEPLYTPLSDSQLSIELSLIAKRNIKVKALNVFSYLAKKKVITYRNHQRHFWQREYRNRRHYYANFFDVVNAFYILGTIRHTEMYLLTILKLVLPLLEKLRRFFYFLDAIIKYMQPIRQKFNCFRLTVTGKLAGGTKRTKNFTIGYGRIPIQTLSTEVTNNFINFTHRFGEFGIKLLMCVDPLFKFWKHKKRRTLPRRRYYKKQNVMKI
jgi:hypothetical protein